jgi:hypothetical protein
MTKPLLYADRCERYARQRGWAYDEHRISIDHLTPRQRRRALRKERHQRPPCGATDGLGLDDDDPEPFGRCTLPAGHDSGGWHQEMRGNRIWAEWRGPAPGERCGICGKDGAEH